MFTRQIKSRISHLHMPNRHSMALHARHLVHDSRFWVVVIGGALIALFILFTIWAGASGSLERPLIPTNPMLPYNY